jgi:uncharacterized HAD superfamily protein
MKLRIGLDCDDTCNYWYELYVDRFGPPKDDATITRHVTRILSKDRDFWLNLPPKHKPDFDVALYCTKRVSPKAWTKKWLEEHDYPKAPIYQVFSQGKNKADLIKGRVDVFVDDSLRNFIALNLAGVPCLLMDSPNNQHWGPIGRVYSLREAEIQEVYELFMNTVFPNFRNLL